MVVKRRSARKAKKRSARKSKKRSARKARKSASKKKTSAKKAPKAGKSKSNALHGGGKSVTKPKGKQMTKTEVTQALEDVSGIKRAVCKKVYEGLLELIYHEMEKRKMFMLHGVCKFVTKRRKARKAGKGTNPFTGEPCIIKARPACNIPKCRPVKSLKDAIA